MAYSEMRGKSFEGECNDCSVVALSVACDISYKIAHEALKKAGRKNRKGVYPPLLIKAAKFLGCSLVEEKFPGKTLITIERDIKRYGGGRRYIIFATGHFVGFNGNEIVDWSKGRRIRINAVYRVKPIEHTQEKLTMVDHTQGEVLSKRDGLIPVTNNTMVQPIAGNWLRDMPRPKGAPKKGTRIKLKLPDDNEIELTVICYLSSQFIAESDAGRERIVHPGDEWEVVL